VNETLKEVHDTTTRIQATLDTLQPFIRDVIHQEFDKTTKLSAQEMQERLPAINHLSIFWW
jgi:hypothetical protein